MRKLAPGKTSSGRAELIGRRLLNARKMPAPNEDGSKEDRGRVLVVGGEREIPGAVLLAGIAALRAGAGKLQIATAASVAVQLGIAIPEARVIGLEEDSRGAIRAKGAREIVPLVEQSHAILIGPGMTNESETSSFVDRVLPHIGKATLILDAGALANLGNNPGSLLSSEGRVILTPHAGEMSKLTGIPERRIRNDQAGFAMTTATALGAVVVLKGSDTYIAAPAGELFVYRAGKVGLATSGSGDTLAGIITGLAARGADPLQAAIWGVFLHGEAGNALAKKSGRVGYLARELLDEIPPLLDRFTVSAG